MGQRPPFLPVVVRVALASLCFILPFGAPCLAGPQPPCNAATAAQSPAYGLVDGMPAVGIWRGADLRREGWQPPACLGWQGGSRLVVALATRIRSPLSLDAIVERLTVASGHPLIKYWATSLQQWLPLAIDARVVDGPDSRTQLPDPSRQALVPGREFYYAEMMEMIGRVVFRVRVLERTEDRLVLAMENVRPIRVAIVTLFEPGALQVVWFLGREAPDTWNLYEIVRASVASNSLVAGYPSSYLNRLDAMRRHLAGLPTDHDPPIAPR